MRQTSIGFKSLNIEIKSKYWVLFLALFPSYMTVGKFFLFASNFFFLFLFSLIEGRWVLIVTTLAKFQTQAY